MMSNLRTDKTWKGGCETVTRSGKRRGKLCNNRFYGRRVIPDGCTMKSCYMHLEGAHLDVEHDQSFYNEGIDDQILSNDFDFIAPEDDGTVLVNGKVFVNKEPEVDVPHEEPDNVANPYDEETESEYVPQEETYESTTDPSFIDAETDAETDAEDEVNPSTSIPNENDDVKTGLSRDVSPEKCDRYFYYKFLEEKEKCDRLEAQTQENKFKLEAEKKKLDDYKREIAASICNVVDNDSSSESINIECGDCNKLKEEKEQLVEDVKIEKSKVESLEKLLLDVEHCMDLQEVTANIHKKNLDDLKQLLADERAEVKELKSRLHAIFKTTNGFQKNMRDMMIASGFCIDEGVGFE
jgi:hypothetical protein